MKYSGIIRDGQASFTDTSLAAYLAANQIDPIQYYLVNNGLKWAKCRGCGIDNSRQII